MLYYFNRLLTFIIIFGGMDMGPQKKLLMIVNPRAGRSKPRGPLYDAAAALCDAGYLLRIRRTTAAGDAARIAAQEGGDYDTVVAVGGDGTLNEVISGIMLNWIFLYATNMILTNVREVASPYTYQMHSAAQQALLPRLLKR